MEFTYSYRKMAELFANSGDPDQKLHSAVSDLGLHCLPVTLLRVSRLQWVNPNGLTHCSWVTPKRVFGKQCRPRSEAAECGV